MGTIVWQPVQLFRTKSRPFPEGKISSMLTLVETFVASLAVGSCDASAAFLGTADPGEDDGTEHRANRKHMLTAIGMRRENRLKLLFLVWGTSFLQERRGNRRFWFRIVEVLF